MKKVLFTLYKNRSHSLYRQFIDNSPEGYKYLTLDDLFEEFIFEKSSNLFLGIWEKIKRNRKIIKTAKENNVDIIYCCDGILLFNSPIPWILELEHASSLIAHNFEIWKIAKKILPLILKQRNLRHIIPWTKAGRDSLASNLILSEDVLSKIKPVHLCLKQIDSFDDVERKKIKHENFSIIFATSVNYNGENEFYSKGGKIVVAVFEKLRKYKDIKLILRSKIPSEFEYLKNDSQVEIYEDVLEYDKFKELFLKSDIFLFPGYQSPGMAFLDAMNYNLPIVTTNVFANNEMVFNNENGYTIRFPEHSSTNYLFKKFGIKSIPSGDGAKYDLLDDKMIDDFVESVFKLKLDSSLLMNMSKRSKEILEKYFSLTKRSEELKNILDNL